MTNIASFHDLTSTAASAGGEPELKSGGALLGGADRDAIHDLVSRLGRWLDEKRYDDPVETAAILAPEVEVVTPGGRAVGLTEVAAQARRGHDAYVTHHLIANVIAEAVDGEPDRAAVRANLQVVFAPPQTDAAPLGEPIFTLGEVYRFAAARTRDGWRLTRVALEPRWKIGDRPPVAA